jgi:hypothetical protein
VLSGLGLISLVTHTADVMMGMCEGQCQDETVLGAYIHVGTWCLVFSWHTDIAKVVSSQGSQSGDQ